MQSLATLVAMSGHMLSQFEQESFEWTVVAVKWIIRLSVQKE